MAIDYTTVKHLHSTIAALAIALLIIRGAWMVWSPAMLQVRWVRIMPHVILAALIVTGIGLAAQLPPGSPHAWLAAKVVALVVYVALTMVVLRRVRTPGARVLTFVAAILVFAYIVGAAVTKSPLSFLARLA